MKCPYYNDYGQECKLYGTRQDDYQRQTYCDNRDNLHKCANYEEARKTNNPRL